MEHEEFRQILYKSEQHYLSSATSSATLWAAMWKERFEKKNGLLRLIIYEQAIWSNQTTTPSPLALQLVRRLLLAVASDLHLADIIYKPALCHSLCPCVVRSSSRSLSSNSGRLDATSPCPPPCSRRLAVLVFETSWLSSESTRLVHPRFSRSSRGSAMVGGRRREEMDATRSKTPLSSLAVSFGPVAL